MHPLIRDEITKAQAADLHRRAERALLVQAAIRARRARPRQRTTPIHGSRSLWRRALTVRTDLH